MSIGINSFEATEECIKIYDPTTKCVIGTYSTYTQAEKATGLTNKILRHAISSKKRKYSPFLKKEIAIRLSSKK